MHYLRGSSLSCKWIPRPDMQLQSLQSDCWPARDKAELDSAAGPERQKQHQHLSAQEWNKSGESFVSVTCAICAAPASLIELKARLRDKRFLLADLMVDRAEPMSRAPSSPIQLFLRDKWVSLEENLINSGTFWAFVFKVFCDKTVTYALSSERRRR